MGAFGNFLLIILITGHFVKKVLPAVEKPPHLLMSSCLRLYSVPLNTTTLEPEVDKVKFLTSGEFVVMEPKHGTDKVYFTSSRSYKIGTYDTVTNTTEYHVPGAGRRFTGIAYDWINRNLYAIDADVQAILVMDDRFRYSTSIYTSRAEITTIAVNPPNRYLFFSSLYFNQTRLIRSNLAGEERKVILEDDNYLQRIDDITVDNENDKVYLLHSIPDLSDPKIPEYYDIITGVSTDGLQKTLVPSRYNLDMGLRGIAAFKNFVYVGQNNRRSSIKKIGKDSYTSSSLDISVCTLVKSATVSKSSGVNEDRLGSCSAVPPCDHICLAQVNTSRICVCSDGYRKVGDTGCQKLEPLSDNFMLVSDVGQGKLFQLSMTTNSSKNFYSYDKPFATEWSLVVADALDARIFWVDKIRNQINAMKANGESARTLVSNITVRDMVYDPLDRNLYVIDDVTLDILVIGGTSGHVATVLPLEKKLQEINTRRKLAIDVEGRYIYWSLLKYARFDEIRRAKLDGTGEELFVDNINQPGRLAINQIRKTLFFTTIHWLYEKLEINALKLSPTRSQSHRKIAEYYYREIKGSDMEAINGRVYLSEKRMIDVFDANLSPSDQDYKKKFVSTKFRNMLSISIYDQATTEKVINELGSPCELSGCEHLCISTGPLKSKCLCNSGYRLVNHTHCEEHMQTDYPPTYVTCPLDQILYQNPCLKTTSVTWETPTWLDDHDAAANLTVKPPKLASPANLTIGVHSFKYTATDSAGNVGVCSFKVILRKFTAECNFETYTASPASMKASRECVDNQFVIELSCIDPPPYGFGKTRAPVDFDPRRNVCVPEDNWINRDYFDCSNSYY